jgi:hypothetical protein
MRASTKGVSMQLRSRRTAVAAVAVAAIAAGGAGVALAARGGEEAGEEHSAFLENVAAELGVEPEALEDAFQTAALDRLDAAVADGRIPEERADQIRERIEQGLPPQHRAFPGHGPFSGHGSFSGYGPYVGLLDTASTYLGLEPEELRARLREGNSLADVARAEGKSVEGLEEALLADARERIHDLVNQTPGEAPLPEEDSGTG